MMRRLLRRKLPIRRLLRKLRRGRMMMIGRSSLNYGKILRRSRMKLPRRRLMRRMLMMKKYLL